MSQFEDYIFEKFKNCILSFDEDLTKDIYCLEVFHGGKDFCQCDFALTYNTKSHLHERMKHVSDDARWDFAEWTCAYPAGVPEDSGQKIQETQNFGQRNSNYGSNGASKTIFLLTSI